MNAILKRQFKIAGDEVARWPSWVHNLPIPHHLHRGRSPTPPPTQLHRNRKKEASRTSCRGEVAG